MFRELMPGETEKDLTKKYLIHIIQEDRYYECDDFESLVATICGNEYFDCEWAETRWHVRRETAGNIGMYLCMILEAHYGLLDDDEENDDYEPIIIYDERIGKIPYNYTDPVVDYDIHGDAKPIHIESDEAFIYSLMQLGAIKVCEINSGELVAITNVAGKLEEELEKFKKLEQDRVPLHKMFGE